MQRRTRIVPDKRVPTTFAAKVGTMPTNIELDHDTARLLLDRKINPGCRITFRAPARFGSEYVTGVVESTDPTLLINLL